MQAELRVIEGLRSPIIIILFFALGYGNFTALDSTPRIGHALANKQQIRADPGPPVPPASSHPRRQQARPARPAIQPLFLDHPKVSAFWEGKVDSKRKWGLGDPARRPARAGQRRKCNQKTHGDAKNHDRFLGNSHACVGLHVHLGGVCPHAWGGFTIFLIDFSLQ